MECIIFDKDGTLMDFAKFWIPVAKKAIDYVCADYSVGEDIKEEILKAIGVDENVDILGVLCYGTYGDIINVVYEVLDKNNVVYDKMTMTKKFPEAFAKARHEGEIAPTSPGLKNTLADLKAKGKKIFVVTSDNYETAEYCLRKLDIFELFDEIIADDGVHPSKPDPYYIDYLVAKYGFSKDEMCMIGDTLADMSFARNGGIKAYGVGVDEKSRSILAEYAEATSSDVSALFKENEI